MSIWRLTTEMLSQTYRYVVKRFPEAGERQCRRIMKRVWKLASAQWEILKDKTERERAAWLLAAAEIEIRKSEMSYSWRIQEMNDFEDHPERD